MEFLNRVVVEDLITFQLYNRGPSGFRGVAGFMWYEPPLYPKFIKNHRKIDPEPLFVLAEPSLLKTL